MWGKNNAERCTYETRMSWFIPRISLRTMALICAWQRLNRFSIKESSFCNGPVPAAGTSRLESFFTIACSSASSKTS
jgi:hypothetical protein